MGNRELSSNVQKILCFIRRFVVSPPNKGVCSRCNIVLFTTKPNLGTDRRSKNICHCGAVPFPALTHFSVRRIYYYFKSLQSPVWNG